MRHPVAPYWPLVLSVADAGDPLAEGLRAQY
jgi:hypothetical protein